LQDDTEIELRQCKRRQSFRDIADHVTTAVHYQPFTFHAADTPVASVRPGAFRRMSAQIEAARLAINAGYEFEPALFQFIDIRLDGLGAPVASQPEFFPCMLGEQGARVVHPVAFDRLVVLFLGLGHRVVECRQLAPQRCFLAHHLHNRLALDLIERDSLDVLKANDPGEHRGHGHGNQHIRNARVHAPQHDHDAEGANGEDKRRPVNLLRGRNHRVPHGLIMMRGLFGTHTENLVELRGGDDDRGGVGEADDDRMRQEVHHHAQAQQAEAELEQADDQRQGDGIGDVTGAAAGRDRLEGRGREQ